MVDISICLGIVLAYFIGIWVWDFRFYQGQSVANDKRRTEEIRNMKSRQAEELRNIKGH